LLFLAVAFGYFFFFGSYVLFFQEQQSLFLYTGSYIDDFLLKPVLCLTDGQIFKLSST